MRTMVSPAGCKPDVSRHELWSVYPGRCGESSRDSPNPGGRLVKVRARQNNAARGPPTCDKHLAVGQQSRCVLPAGGVEAARDSPLPACRVVKFRANHDAAIIPTYDEHLPIGQ